MRFDNQKLKYPAAVPPASNDQRVLVSQAVSKPLTR